MNFSEDLKDIKQIQTLSGLLDQLSYFLWEYTATKDANKRKLFYPQGDGWSFYKDTQHNIIYLLISLEEKRMKDNVTHQLRIRTTNYVTKVEVYLNDKNFIGEFFPSEAPHKIYLYLLEKF